MNFVYNHTKYLLASGGLNLLTDNLAILLVSSTYKTSNTVANLSDANTIADLVSYELTTNTVANYTRLALSDRTVTEYDDNDFACLSASNVAFVALGTGNTIGGAILVNDTVSNATSTPIAFYDLLNTPTNGGDITIQWATSENGGVLKLS